MISAMALLMYQRDAKRVLMEHGNKQLDRNVFAYLVDCIDLRTGLIGSPFKVSHSRIASEISEQGGQGTKSVPMVFTSRAVRNAIDRLCEYGLYQRVSQKGVGGQLVLLAVIEKSANAADSHFSAQKEVGMKLASSRQGQGVDLSGVYGGSESASCPEVGISSPSFLPSISDNPVVGADHRGVIKSISLDWEPSEKFKSMINQTYTPCAVTAKRLKTAIVDFKLYWSAQDKQLTQTEWESKLFRNDLRPVLMGEQVASRAVKPAQGAQAGAGSVKRNAKVLSVPEKLYGELLQQWGVRHGFRMVNPGESDIQYRRALQNYVARRNAQVERGVVGE